MACLLHRSRGPHTRRTDAANQTTVAYLSGRGQRVQMFLAWVPITSYTTASTRQCKCGRFSLLPYSKQEHPLFTAVVRPRPTAGLWFTARCYASAVLAMGLCPSVCLSVTSRCSTKTAKRRITQTTPHDSPGTLVFWCQRCPRNSTGVTSYEGAECRWGGSKSATFDE